MMARVALAACVLSGVACASHAPLPTATSPRFEAPDQILVAPESGSVTIKVRQPGRMLHPPATMGRTAEAWSVVAYVIDTTGRVERRTVSFFPPLPPAAFRESICNVAYTERFAPPLSGGQVRRVLIVQSFTFGPNMNTGPGAMAEVKRISEELRSTPPREALARLEPLPHCDNDE